MRRVRKRVFSLLLAIVMTVSLLPTSAWAADSATPIEEEAWNSGGYYVPAALQGNDWEFSDAVTMVGCDLVYARYEHRVWNGNGYDYEYARRYH